MIVGVLLLAATFANLSMFPHPVWMWVVGLAEILPLAYLGARLTSRGTLAGKPELVTPQA
jgi:hypothetical protein